MTEQVRDYFKYGKRWLELGWLDYGQSPMDGCPNLSRFNFRARNTANWRGYVATWKIDKNALWLIDFTGHINPEEVGSKLSSMASKQDNPAWYERECLLMASGCIGISQLFDGDPGPILASWFSGSLSARSKYDYWSAKFLIHAGQVVSCNEGS